jgi:uncharacterized Tic20 family protein
MPIVVVCPSCKAKMKAPDNLVGKTVKCPGCAALVQVKAAASAPAPAPAAPAPAPVVRKPAPKPVEEVEEVAPIEDEEAAPPPPPGGPSTDKERSTAMWIHLLPIVLACCGGIGTFISLFLWISKRKESAFIDHHGKTWLNFLINMMALSIGLVVLSLVLGFVGGMISQTLGTIISSLFGLVMFALAVYSIVMYVMVGLKAKKGEWAEYRVLFKVLK